MEQLKAHLLLKFAKEVSPYDLLLAAAIRSIVAASVEIIHFHGSGNLLYYVVAYSKGAETDGKLFKELDFAGIDLPKHIQHNDVVGYAAVRTRGGKSGTKREYFVSGVEVDKAHRRQGIASKMYAYIEKKLGLELSPEIGHQTSEAQSLWKTRKWR